MAAGPQAVSQHNYSQGPGDRLSAGPQEQHCLSRPVSGLLPAIEASEDEISVAPKLSVAENSAQEAHDGKQLPVPKGAHKSGEAAAAAASENVQVA